VKRQTSNVKVERGVQAERNDRPPDSTITAGLTCGDETLDHEDPRKGQMPAPAVRKKTFLGACRGDRTSVLSGIAYHRAGDLSRG
jgi:hypothetical protein